MADLKNQLHNHIKLLIKLIMILMYLLQVLEVK